MFPCEDISLEGIWHIPDGRGPFPAGVVCHPHPLYGGDMFNTTVEVIYNEMVKRGWAAFRFNFRGVGRSTGKSEGGIAEIADLKAAVDYVFNLSEFDGRNLGVAGYSFGAEVAARLAPLDRRITSLALVSPVFGEEVWSGLKQYTGQKLMVAGSEDQYIDIRLYKQKMLADPRESHIVSGADHFWAGFENVLGNKIGTFFETALKPK